MYETLTEVVVDLQAQKDLASSKEESTKDGLDSGARPKRQYEDELIRQRSLRVAYGEAIRSIRDIIPDVDELYEKIDNYYLDTSGELAVVFTQEEASFLWNYAAVAAGIRTVDTVDKLTSSHKDDLAYDLHSIRKRHKIKGLEWDEQMKCEVCESRYDPEYNVRVGYIDTCGKQDCFIEARKRAEFPEEDQ